MIQAVQSIE